MDKISTTKAATGTKTQQQQNTNIFTFGGFNTSKT